VDLGLDWSLTAGYESPRQQARVLSEGWARREMYCLACESPRLEPTVGNTRARDFSCPNPECREPYELKVAQRPFRSSVVDGAFDSMLETVRGGRAPNLLLLHYDLVARRVVELDAIHRTLLTPSCVVRRRAPLPPGTHRAGWLGCSLRLGELASDARVPIVRQGMGRSVATVRAEWARFQFLVNLEPAERGWLGDVLACVDRLRPGGPFSLQDLYAFKEELGFRHPGNRNIEPKIRQQLQVLVRAGRLERLSPGRYSRRLAPG
jgi:type II restriction enzyme